MTQWRVGWLWYAGTALGVPALIVVTGLALSGENIQMPPVAALVAYVPGLLLQMVTTGLAEEPGWRDFALPRMQRRFGPLGATAILGPLWGAWHLPLFLSEWGGWPDVTWMRIGEFVAFATVFSVIVTWVAGAGRAPHGRPRHPAARAGRPGARRRARRARGQLRGALTQRRG